MFRHSLLPCACFGVALGIAAALPIPAHSQDRSTYDRLDRLERDLNMLQRQVYRGGPAPVRAYIDELLPDILEGRIEPGRVFDRVVDLDGVPDGYRAMNERESIKVLVKP